VLEVTLFYEAAALLGERCIEVIEVLEVARGGGDRGDRGAGAYCQSLLLR
jgi:hypothetical protein